MSLNPLLPIALILGFVFALLAFFVGLTLAEWWYARKDRQCQ